MDFHYQPITLQFLGYINTPNIFGPSGFLDFSSFETEKMELSENTILDLEIFSNQILGKRVEVFFAYYIRHYSESILAQNHVISKDKISLGEVDFLLMNQESQKICHVELVYKYYLYDPSFENEMDRWIGPNRRDTLVGKLEKLENHQFPLIFRPEAEEFLNKHTDFIDNIEQKVCFKASLFVPHHKLGLLVPLVNNSCIIGYWIKLEDFSEDLYGSHMFYSPEKQNWPVDPIYCTKWFSFQDIWAKLESLLKQQRSPLVWMTRATGEIERFFIVWW